MTVGPRDSSRTPRYAGIATFALLPRLDQVEHADIAVVGIPFDTGVSGRTPTALRLCAQRGGGTLMARLVPATQRPVGQPSVHVRAVVTWIAIFPLDTIASLAIAPVAQDRNPIVRAFVLSIRVVPVAVYVVVPRLLPAYTRLRASRGSTESAI